MPNDTAAMGDSIGKPLPGPDDARLDGGALVGRILGEQKINIANFSLGRRVGRPNSGEPNEAIAVVHVDGRVPDKVLDELKKVPAVRQAKAILLL